MGANADVRADAERVRAQYGVTVDEHCNIPPALLAKVGRNLHLQPRHPLNTIKQLIQDALQKSARRLNEEPYAVHDRLSPFVTTQQNFDDLLTPPDHVSRRPTDTYYANASVILRTHTSAHQTQLIRAAEVRRQSLAFSPAAPR